MIFKKWTKKCQYGNLLSEQENEKKQAKGAGASVGRGEHITVQFSGSGTV